VSDTTPTTDRRLTAWLLGWTRPYLPRLMAAALLVMLGSTLRVVGPLLTAAAVDLFLTPTLERASGDTAISASPEHRHTPPPGGSGAARRVAAVLRLLRLPTSGLPGLAAVAALYLASLLLAAGVLILEARTVLMTGQYVMRDLRDALFAHLQNLHLAWFHRTPVGRVITRLTADVEALNEIFTSGMVDIVADLVLVSGIMAVLVFMDWRLALVAFSVLPLQLAFSFWFRSRARLVYREVRARLAAINTHLQEHLSGIAVVQLAGAEGRTEEVFRATDAAHRDANIRGIAYYALFYPGVEFLTALGFSLLLVTGGMWSVSGTVSLGVLVAFLQYVQRFYRPLADLAENYNVLQASLAASERLQALLATKPELAEAATPVTPPPRAGTFSLENVSFAYDGDHWALRHVSIAAQPGQRIAVVGHTGAGKSTLVNLLLRFYDPQAGRVLVDGVDVRTWPLLELRRRFAVVLQEVDCFAGTLRDNVTLCRPGLSDERVRWALEQVQAGPLLSRLGGRLDVALGERGVGLSAGERQLISFARALVGDPEFLVLDEATAAVDAVTEDAIQQALTRLLAGRTALVIAHRLTTVMGCDRVVVLHEGRVVQEGTHRELVARPGVYRTLYELQFFKGGGNDP